MDGNIKYLMFGMIFLMIGIVSASNPYFGTFQTNQKIDLKQVCFINGTICDACNITSIDYPNGSSAVTNVYYTQQTSDFNYSFARTFEDGRYNVNGFCSFGSDVKKPFTYYFEVTPTGFVGTLGFYILILVLSLGIIILGFYLGDAPITILGSFGLYFISLYILFYGIVGMKDAVYTWGIGLIVLALAIYISIRSAYELVTNAGY